MPLEKEPQNALTSRFTDAEWRVLKELRTSLPDIFAEAFPLKKDAAETPVSIWGVKIDPQNPIYAKTSVVLMQFLRSENLSVTSAWNRLRDTLRWRDRVDIEKALRDFPPKSSEEKLLGYDKEGRRVVLMRKISLRRTLSTAGVKDIDEYRRQMISAEERSKRQHDFEERDQYILIKDLRAFPGGILGPAKMGELVVSDPSIKEVEEEIRRYYPTPTHTTLFINAPGWLMNVKFTQQQLQSLASNYVIRASRKGQAVRRALEPIIATPEPDTASYIDGLVMPIGERMSSWVRN